MFICVVILILFLPVTFLPLAIGTLFTSHELSDMGICLEHPQSPEQLLPVPWKPIKAVNNPQICSSCLSI